MQSLSTKLFVATARKSPKQINHFGRSLINRPVTVSHSYKYPNVISRGFATDEGGFHDDFKSIRKQYEGGNSKKVEVKKFIEEV